MSSRFVPGATVHTKDGRVYTVEEVVDGTVYCRSDGGAETEFAKSSLFTDAEWAAKSSGRRDSVYARLKQSKPYVAAASSGGVSTPAVEQVLAKAERLSPGLLDYAAFSAAGRALADSGESDLADDLSVVKCRAVFDSASPATRLGLLAHLLAIAPAALLDAGRLGDNLMRALIEKGLAPQADAFDAFLDRPRR